MLYHNKIKFRSFMILQKINLAKQRIINRNNFFDEFIKIFVNEEHLKWKHQRK